MQRYLYACACCFVINHLRVLLFLISIPALYLNVECQFYKILLEVHGLNLCNKRLEISSFSTLNGCERNIISVQLKRVAGNGKLSKEHALTCNKQMHLFWFWLSVVAVDCSNNSLGFGCFVGWAVAFWKQHASTGNAPY